MAEREWGTDNREDEINKAGNIRKVFVPLKKIGRRLVLSMSKRPKAMERKI